MPFGAARPGLVRRVEVAPDGGTVEEVGGGAAEVGVTAAFGERKRGRSPCQYRYHRVEESEEVSDCNSVVPVGEGRMTVAEAEERGFKPCRNCFPSERRRCPLCGEATAALAHHLPECPARERAFPEASAVTDGGEGR